MNNSKGTMDHRELKIQGVLDGYLRTTSSNNDLNLSNHLDEDTLTAFVEGNLTETEAKPITTHLVSCSFCRHISAELIKLDMAFAEEAQVVTITESEPTKVSEVLGGILTRIFGTNDSAVFAHQEDEKDESEVENESEEEE